MAATNGRARTRPEPTNHPAPDQPGLDQRVATLEGSLAETKQQVLRLATALASLLAQSMQPQLQQSLVGQLLGGDGPGQAPVSSLIAQGRPLTEEAVPQPPVSAIAET